MKKIFGAVALVVGAAVGFFAGKMYYQEKYRKLSEQEIEIMREYYRKKKAESKQQSEKPDVANTGKPSDDILNTSTQVYADGCQLTEDPPITKDESSEEQKPAAFSKYWKKVEGYKSSTPEKPGPEVKPYIIRPDELGDAVAGYEVTELTYYRDGVLADERDIIMGKEDIEAAIGRGTVDQMGLYEPDILHVRNPKYHIDYEITADNRTYLDVVGEKPHLLER